ncbi:MAG: ABC transporter ATP-binding protein [Planctomycetota bacterium]
MQSPAETIQPEEKRGVTARLLRLAWAYRSDAVKVLALQLVLLIMGLLGLGFTGLGIDVIRHAVQPDSPAPTWPLGLSPPADWSTMQVLALVASGVLIMALVRNFLHGWYTISMAQLLQAKIVVDLRRRIYGKLQRLSFDFYDSNTTGSIINRVTGDVQNVRLFVDGVVMQILILAISLAIYLVYMVSIHPTLTLACLASTPLIYLLARRFSRIVQPAYRRQRELMDQLLLDVSENVQGMHVIKGFARQQEEIDGFTAGVDNLRAHQMWIFRRVTTYPQIIGMLTHLNLVVLIAYGGWLVIQGRLPLGAGMVVFAGLLQQFSGQVQNLANVANSMQQSLIAARRVFEVLDTPLSIRSAPDAVKLESPEGLVEFRNVSFGYKHDEPVLQDVTFTVPPGASVAILGATGSGKSTLLSLIPRFYDPQVGQVLIDGIDLRKIEVDSLRRSIGLVFQESFLFSATVAENIAFGHPEASREQVERAAKIAAAHEFITQLPKGYDSPLREAGADLSGGQRQRLAIARALLLQPAILLLDDPTAAIDPNTEQEILSAMHNAMAGRTTFVIAHRLSTLKRADMIFVLQAGRIVQVGNHDELMAQKGPYRWAARLQVADDSSRRALAEPIQSAEPTDPARGIET